MSEPTQPPRTDADWDTWLQKHRPGVDRATLHDVIHQIRISVAMGAAPTVAEEPVTTDEWRLIQLPESWGSIPLGSVDGV